MRVGTITQLWRYPVKSMGGERRESVRLTRRGIPGDRGWAAYDETRRGITGAKRLAGLRACTARYAVEPIAGAASPEAEITLPDGSTLSTAVADTVERLSTALARPVTLRRLGADGHQPDARLTATDESEAETRAAMGLLPGEPEADMSDLSGERLDTLRVGNFFDAYPIHLLTRTTLRTLAQLAPESIWDERRFRPNLFVEAVAADGYPELEWLNRRIRVGGAVIGATIGCPRCVMVTQPVDELPQDHRVMRTLVRETHHTAGLYAEVVEEGDVRVGDSVDLLP